MVVLEICFHNFLCNSPSSVFLKAQLSYDITHTHNYRCRSINLVNSLSMNRFIDGASTSSRGIPDSFQQRQTISDNNSFEFTFLNKAHSLKDSSPAFAFGIRSTFVKYAIKQNLVCSAYHGLGKWQIVTFRFVYRRCQPIFYSTRFLKT